MKFITHIIITNEVYSKDRESAQKWAEDYRENLSDFLMAKGSPVAGVRVASAEIAVIPIEPE